ncbi:SAC3/GANP family protein [Toxoplasma gondii TgCatPRC2]|uniref:Eukaryotic translation initiation factor 3 subunit K n=15 Tax=Toxoplasma gondii TaxID=5811 RepID=A0A125YTI3_TOXGV|nr:SAC3/GANP family protein [Toxoplasma gondii ME49]EPR62576.1 SAC3/GANP family protein [Toxoplasma gondii GT1]ESS31957.1 SAC3/GANP family protein [Toxoplasma gondii VEG]KAF4641071.1 SAC3/GANP family protein [Toxoplasma gondii]KFG39477.1 SAC3/GANP family protein [Toxoplasma gondii p89]KFG49489.1 SAC3/GANP family protein [Toxoplasma gondii GAB2-2007-GAL-DOM2]KFG52708.1 SAC3/GANP family protein [Toxoplasma gondii FOU]KFG65449.1 SAC3/GANP family protein [Toxoplasma gondii RUB]KFH10486.1 SAC3/G|eukprot:XP_002365326.1 SAC3/GANP family protein [Toxoplasma gondii ME49]
MSGAASATTPPLAAQVQALLQAPELRYDPSSLTLLCQYTEEQVAKNTYDQEACLAVLKLYLLYPQCFSVDLARKILVKGIMNLPNEDCAVFVGMLQQQPGKKDWKKVQEAIHLWELLEKCRFKQVWEFLKEPAMADVVSTPGLVDSIRRFVCDVVSLTYSALSLADLCAFLNVVPGTSEAERLLKNLGWTVEEVFVPAKEAARSRETVKVVRVVGSASLAAAALKEGEERNRNRDGKPGAAGQALAVRKTVEKYMMPENLKVCMATLLK